MTITVDPETMRFAFGFALSVVWLATDAALAEQMDGDGEVNVMLLFITQVFALVVLTAVFFGTPIVLEAAFEAVTAE